MNQGQFEDQFTEFQMASLGDSRFQTPGRDKCIPVLNEDGRDHGMYCFVYAMHTGWAARILNETGPRDHVDIGSQVYFACTASAMVWNFYFYDYRKVHLPLDNLSTGTEDLTKLTFKDNSVRSLSCMHTLEHCGLGRYGDPIGPQDDIKAAGELTRVLASDGQLLMVLPVNKTARIVFNAHRIYTYQMVLDMFKGLKLVEFTLIDDHKITRDADPADIRDVKWNEYEDCGCFHFVKE